jgi:hypothetical protein
MWHRRPRLCVFLPSRGRLGHIFNGLLGLAWGLRERSL